MREATPVILESTITCPHCGTAKAETMPTDVCQFFYVHWLRRASTAEDRRLLRILLARFCAMSTYPGGRNTYMPAAMTGDRIPTGGCAHCGLTAHKGARREFLDDR